MSSDERRFALGAAATLLATLSCGTIQAVSHDSKDEWFPGVHHDVAWFGHASTVEVSSEPLSAACDGMCLAVPVVIEAALTIVDIPFSFIADLVVMPFWTPVEAEARSGTPRARLPASINPHPKAVRARDQLETKEE